jgi:leucyl-tRNA---protein transferase
MIDALHFVENLDGAILDHYLANGWYRMGPFMFTSHTIDMEDNAYRVLWLRYKAQHIRLNKTHHDIYKRNKNFTVAIKKLVITDELEQLYNNYRQHIRFEISETLEESLYRNLADQTPLPNVFNSMVIEVRADKVLIAAGIFDIGNNSIAGIVNFYNPQYKKYSLGKYLMLQKLNYAQQTFKEYYYPGYIVIDYPKFDYKLFLGKTQAEIWKHNNWQPYAPSVHTITIPL